MKLLRNLKKYIYIMTARRLIRISDWLLTAVQSKIHVCWTAILLINLISKITDEKH